MMYPPGKLPNAVLEKLLANRAQSMSDPRVLVGPRVGEDAAVLDFGDRVLVITTDPITFATDHPGWYAVQVNANDVATRGARPRWFLAVLLLPEKETDDGLITALFEQIQAACADLGCTLIGGHTEITLGIDRPIVVGQMLGEVARDRLVTTGGAQVGDVLLLTQGIAIEGTALLARERHDALLAHGLSPSLLARAQELLFAPGISIVRAALIANDVARIHAMHDPTEGGLATGAAEMAQAARLGLRLDRAAIPILPECNAICQAFGLDPLGLLASGALLLAVAPADADRVIAALQAQTIRCTPIGEMVPASEGLLMKTQDRLADLTVFARDEVTRALE
ncbi:MAG: AIR synthase family protein [Anaerolineae bacterium]